VVRREADADLVQRGVAGECAEVAAVITGAQRRALHLGEVGAAGRRRRPRRAPEKVSEAFPGGFSGKTLTHDALTAGDREELQAEADAFSGKAFDTFSEAPGHDALAFLPRPSKDAAVAFVDLKNDFVFRCIFATHADARPDAHARVHGAGTRPGTVPARQRLLVAAAGRTPTRSRRMHLSRVGLEIANHGDDE